MSTEKFAWPKVGRMLGELRAHKQMTLADVQARTKLSKPTIINAERGGDIRLSTLQALLRAYGVKPDTVILATDTDKG